MRAVLAVILLAISATMAWWWFPAGTPPPAYEQLTTGNARAAPIGATPHVVAERINASQGTTASKAPPIAAPAAWVEVHIFDAATKAPIAGADVWWKDASCDECVEALPKAERGPFYDDAERVCRAFGWHARADERGSVRVHADELGTSVVARAEGRWGSVNVVRADATRGVELWLFQDLEVTVRVVDGLGQPVPEVPVDLDHSSGMVTDASGLVVFQHLQVFVEKDDDGAWIARNEGAFIAIPGLHQQRVTFPLLTPPKEPMTLLLPATGEMHLHVLHPGRAVEGAAAELWIAAAKQEEKEIIWSRRADADGVVRFRHLPLAQIYELRTSIGDFTMQHTMDGPRSQGQVVHATFEVPADTIALTGRILTADGRPVTSTDSWIEFNLSGRTSRCWVTTDAQGRFVCHPRADDDGQADSALDTFRVTWRRGMFDTLHGSVAPRKLQHGVNDIGDIRLDHPPLVVAGRFTFDRPAKWDDVEFHVERWDPGDCAGKAGDWRSVGDLDADHDREGRFVVRGDPPPGRLRLNCGVHAEPVEFERGTTDLVIQFLRGHSVTAWLSVGKSVPFHADAARTESLAHWFDVELTREGASADAQVLPANDGKADFRPLVAGTYRVDVRLGSVPKVIASEHIVLPGPNGEFERGIDIDLRDRVEVLRLRFLDNGEPAVGERYVLLDQGLGANPMRGYIASGSEFVMPIAPGAVDITILGENHEPVFMHAVRGTIDVPLTERATVQLTARGLSELGEQQDVGLSIAGDAAEGPEDKVTLYDAGRRVRTIETPTLFGRGSCYASLGPDSVAEIRAAQHDRAFVAEFRGQGPRRPLHSFSPKIIPAGTAPLTITFDQAELRAAIEADQQDHKRK
jgi:hypothetical protein